jgi:hypothetical protein
VIQISEPIDPAADAPVSNDNVFEEDNDDDDGDFSSDEEEEEDDKRYV